MSTVKVYQSTARADCRSQNAELVSISDQDENNFVTSICGLVFLRKMIDEVSGKEWSFHVHCIIIIIIIIATHSSHFDCAQWQCDVGYCGF